MTIFKSIYKKKTLIEREKTEDEKGKEKKRKRGVTVVCPTVLPIFCSLLIFTHLDEDHLPSHVAFVSPLAPASVNLSMITLAWNRLGCDVLSLSILPHSHKSFTHFSMVTWIHFSSPKQ